MQNLSHIRAQIEALKAQELEILTTQRKAAADEAKKLIAEFGLSASEVGLGGSGRVVIGRAIIAAKPAKAAKAARTVRYQDGSNTWSGGRGPKPNWVKAVLAAGGDVEKFRV